MLTFLVISAFFAGLVDAVAGGGGLIQLPAMLIALPKTEVVSILGTNKVMAIFGTSASATNYLRKIKIKKEILFAMSIPAFLGSAGGALLASHIPAKSLRPVVVLLLILVFIYTWKKPELGKIENLRHTHRKNYLIGAGSGLVIGFYDGLIGPGTGSFLILALVALMGYAFLSASAIAKVVNIATNLGAIVIFGLHGVVMWKLGLTLAVANVAGGVIGSHLAIKNGSSFVRKVFLFITFILICKVAFDTITSW